MLVIVTTSIFVLMQHFHPSILLCHRIDKLILGKGRARFLLSRQYFSCQVKRFPFICYNIAFYNLRSCVERVELIMTHGLVIKVFQTKFITVSNSQSRAQQGRNCSDLCSLTVSNFLCSPLFKHSATPHFEQSSVPC